MTDLVVRAERVLLEGEVGSAAVAVADGRIVEIGAVDAEFPASVAEVLVPTNAVLLPGFVDTHVHINEPGTDWEGFATATAAAAAGGITTLVDMPLDSDPVTTSVAALRAKQAVARSNCHVDVGFWGGVVPENLKDLAALAQAGVRGFKCFLTDSGNPDFSHLSPGQFREAMARIAELGSVLLVHAESHHVIAESPRPYGRRYASFLDSRPDAAEEDAVALVLDAAAASRARAHIVHVSSSRVLAQLAEAKRSGVPVTAETCPHYLTFAAEAIPDGGTEFAACPPIRGGANRELLWDGLRAGTLDMVVSDHSPCAPRVQGRRRLRAGVRRGQLAAARSPGSVDAGRAPGFRLGRVEPVDVRAARGARRVRRPRADRRRTAGRPVCLRPRSEEVVDASALRHRHPVSPYHGVALRGSVLQTWVSGQSAFGAVCEPA